MKKEEGGREVMDHVTVGEGGTEAGREGTTCIGGREG